MRRTSSQSTAQESNKHDNNDDEYSPSNKEIIQSGRKTTHQQHKKCVQWSSDFQPTELTSIVLIKDNNNLMEVFF
jgi:hypothetical protein